MAPSGIQNHSDQALILNKEVYRHVRQRRRRRRGGGSAQSQLEVQQIDTFDSGDTFGSGGGGHGQGQRLRNDTFSRGSLSMPLHLPPMTTNYIAQWQVSLC